MRKFSGYFFKIYEPIMIQDDIYNLISDININDQFVECFKIRELDQKLLYLWKWANLYYIDKNVDNTYDYNWITKKMLDRLNVCKYFWNRNNLFISLGCGKAYMDAVMLKYVIANNYQLNYFGVDISKSMLNMSIDTLRAFDIKKKFVLSDVFSRDFKDEISRLSCNYDNRIYTIFNNTFGNLNQTRVINNLNNILISGDKLWIDVRMNLWKWVVGDLELFNTYSKSLKSKTRQDFLCYIFDRFLISRENYYFSIETRRDKVLGSLVFDLIANFSKKTSCDIYWNKIIILPGERFKINHIYTYDAKMLISFFEEHWFCLKEKYVDQKRWHFIFEKE